MWQWNSTGIPTESTSSFKKQYLHVVVPTALKIFHVQLETGPFPTKKMSFGYYHGQVHVTYVTFFCSGQV